MIGLLKKPLPIFQSGGRELQNALLVIHWVVRGPEQGSECCFADVTRNFKIQQRGWQRGRQKKNNRFYKQNNNFFVHFCPCLHDYDVKMPNFTFHGVRKQPTTKFCFSFCTWIWSLGIQLAYILQSKLVGIIAIKTEKTQIHFLSDVLVAVASLDLKVPTNQG